METFQEKENFVRGCKAQKCKMIHSLYKQLFLLCVCFSLVLLINCPNSKGQDNKKQASVLVIKQHPNGTAISGKFFGIY